MVQWKHTSFSNCQASILTPQTVIEILFLTSLAGSLRKASSALQFCDYLVKRVWQTAQAKGIRLTNRDFPAKVTARVSLEMELGRFSLGWQQSGKQVLPALLSYATEAAV